MRLDPHPLHPETEPHASGRLPVDDLHTLAWWRIGNPKGVPVVFLHGGPGGTTRPFYRRFYDPAFYDLIMFDQRGAGQSTPNSELRDNTTWNLVDDIEKLRVRCGVDKWLVSGGSWGSTLAMVYAIAHPERCLGLVMNGISIGEAENIRFWFHGIGNIFPDAWEEFAGFIPEAERGDLLAAYHKRVVDPDPKVHLPAAVALRTFSGRTQAFAATPESVGALLAPELCLPLARFFTHYVTRDSFLQPNHILDNLARIRHLPCILVQGRYDLVTRPLIAWRLHQAWPESELVFVDRAGHSTLESPMAETMCAAFERMKERLKMQGLAPRA
jgi:proline iminopeptidase